MQKPDTILPMLSSSHRHCLGSFLRGALIAAVASLSSSTELLAQTDFKAGTQLVVHGASTSDKLNLRAQPSATSRVLAELPPEATDLIATGRSKMNGPDKWIEVRFGSQVGWVHSRFIRPAQVPATVSNSTDAAPDANPLEPLKSEVSAAPAVEMKAGTNLRVEGVAKDDKLNLRAEASGNAAVLMELDPGAGIVTTGRSKRNKGQVWLEVKFGDKAGWVNSLFVREVESENSTRPEEDASAKKGAPKISEEQIAKSTDPVADCNSADAARKLHGCTSFIENPNTPSAARAIALSRRSDAYLLQSKLDEAVADREQAIALEPSEQSYKTRLSDLLRFRADLRLSQNDTAGAVTDYGRAIDIDPQNSGALIGQGRVHTQEGRVNEAILAIEKAATIHPLESDIKSLLALLYDKQGLMRMKKSEFQPAIESFSNAISLTPTEASLYNHRAAAYADLGDSASAITDLTESIEFDSSQGAAYLRRGLFYHAQKQYSQAIADFREALTRDVKNKSARLSLGLAQEASGFLDEARETYKGLVKIDPKNKDAKSGLRRVEGTLRLKAAPDDPALTANGEPKAEFSQPTFSGSYSIYVNADLEGSDMRNFKTADQFDCASACQSDNNCVAFTFDKWNRLCFLKDAAGWLRFEPKCVSGIVGTNPAPEWKAASLVIERYRKQAFPKGGRQLKNAKSFESCESGCRDDVECVAFTFSRKDSRCRLLTVAEEYFASGGSDSGVKRQLPSE